MKEENDADRMLRAQREWNAAQKQNAAPAAVSAESWPIQKVLLAGACLVVPVVLLLALARPGSSGDAQDQQVAETTPPAQANASYVRPEIPRRPDPVVIAQAQKLLLDENGKLKDPYDDWLRLDARKMAYELIESGHTDGVLTLSRDLCAAGGKIPSQEQYHACIFATEINATLIENGHLVAASDAIYRNFSMAGYLDEHGRGSSGEDHLEDVGKSIDKAESLGADPREIASVRKDLADAKQFVIDRRNRNAALVVGALGALFAGGGGGSNNSQQGHADDGPSIKEQMDKADADSCAWQGKSTEHYYTGSC